MPDAFSSVSAPQKATSTSTSAIQLVQIEELSSAKRSNRGVWHVSQPTGFEAGGFDTLRFRETPDGNWIATGAMRDAEVSRVPQEELRRSAVKWHNRVDVHLTADIRWLQRLRERRAELLKASPSGTFNDPDHHPGGVRCGAARGYLHARNQPRVITALWANSLNPAGRNPAGWMITISFSGASVSSASRRTPAAPSQKTVTERRSSEIAGKPKFSFPSNFPRQPIWPVHGLQIYWRQRQLLPQLDDTRVGPGRTT